MDVILIKRENDGLFVLKLPDKFCNAVTVIDADQSFMLVIICGEIGPCWNQFK